MPGLAVLQGSPARRPDAVDDAPDIDADDEGPSRPRHVHQPGAVHRHAGIVKDDVELAEAALGLGQRVESRLLLSDVDPDREHLLVGAGQQVLPPAPRRPISMSAITTLAPASASAVAMPRPMPEAAPVTMAVCRKSPWPHDLQGAAAQSLRRSCLEQTMMWKQATGIGQRDAGPSNRTSAPFVIGYRLGYDSAASSDSHG